MCRELTCNSRSELLGADPLSTTTTSAKEMAAEPEPIEENHHSLSEVEVGHGQRRPTGVHSPELRAVEISHTHRDQSTHTGVYVCVKRTAERDEA
ncbi:hypothetical protein E3N88_23228 [Mikania micrantha]|uniref:Uncharacterized protein n=1 Tax=Mikania micrantha TaxID=192012 RepID=A0A5N6NEJ6_9ASTR|nr:hypothetical protein E3N88_23228 [Mikania micrantha]